jgi:hypothetical protein
MTATQYVILEWNQAGGDPKIAVDDLYNDPAEAREAADTLKVEARSSDRWERYTVHELDMEEADA